MKYFASRSPIRFATLLLAATACADADPTGVALGDTVQVTAKGCLLEPRPGADVYNNYVEVFQQEPDGSYALTDSPPHTNPGANVRDAAGNLVDYDRESWQLDLSNARAAYYRLVRTQVIDDGYGNLSLDKLVRHIVVSTGAPRLVLHDLFCGDGDDLGLVDPPDFTFDFLDHAAVVAPPPWDLLTGSAKLAMCSPVSAEDPATYQAFVYRFTAPGTLDLEAVASATFAGAAAIEIPGIPVDGRLDGAGGQPVIVEVRDQSGGLVASTKTTVYSEAAVTEGHPGQRSSSGAAFCF